jgi:hypothetical protein
VRSSAEDPGAAPISASWHAEDLVGESVAPRLVPRVGSYHVSSADWPGDARAALRVAFRRVSRLDSLGPAPGPAPDAALDEDWLDALRDRFSNVCAVSSDTRADPGVDSPGDPGASPIRG